MGVWERGRKCGRTGERESEREGEVWEVMEGRRDMGRERQREHKIMKEATNMQKHNLHANKHKFHPTLTRQNYFSFHVMLENHNYS